MIFYCLKSKKVLCFATSLAENRTANFGQYFPIYKKALKYNVLCSGVQVAFDREKGQECISIKNVRDFILLVFFT